MQEKKGYNIDKAIIVCWYTNEKHCKKESGRVRYCYSLSLIDTKDKMKEALIIK